MKKRILVIAPTPYFSDRGCHVRIFEEARSLMARGYEVMICTYHLGRNIPGIVTKRIVPIPWCQKLPVGPSIHKFYLDGLLLFCVIWNCIRYKPDILHAHLHEGIFIGRIPSFLFSVPLVGDLQGSLTGELIQHGFIKKNGFFYKLFRWMENIVIKMPQLTFTSFSIRNNGDGKHTESQEKKVFLVPDGVDTEMFKPGRGSLDLKHKIGIPKEKIIVGFLGLLNEYQGVPVLMKSIPKVVRNMKKVHFLIMGFPNVEYYQKMAEELGIQNDVKFTGKIPYESVPSYLGICDIAVSPKLLTTEANGKLLNYMAMGLPIVATDTPVNRSILGDLGVYSEPGNPNSLSDTLLKLLSDLDLGSSLGKKLRTKALEEYSWDSIGERISISYSELLRGDNKKPQGKFKPKEEKI